MKVSVVPFLAKYKIPLCLAFSVLALLPQRVVAQGCILTRNTSPVLGAQISPYLQKGEWQAGMVYRQFTADHQYQGTELSPLVTALGTNVISKMYYTELTATGALNPQWNLSLSLPIILNASSNRALPQTSADSPRFVQSTSGIGDTIFTARHWIMNTDHNTTQNVSVGAGLKIPTGNENASDKFPNALGQDLRERVVDQSIQLGDSGWGFLATLEAFKQFGNLSVFGSGVYLFNPKGQNRTLSPPSMLNPVGPLAVNEKQRFNTVSDSYLVRAGVAYALPPLQGLSLSLAGRIEGVPVNDLFGTTAGFRRPGYYLTLEPGIIYSRAKTTLALNVPCRLHQNVKPSLGFVRDSTFAGHTFLASATYRFGGKH